jgi:hypothetical protein
MRQGRIRYWGTNPKGWEDHHVEAHVERMVEFKQDYEDMEVYYGSWPNDQGFLNDEQCANRQDGDWWAHRLNERKQKEELKGEVMHDRAWNENRSPLGIDHQ